LLFKDSSVVKGGIAKLLNCSAWVLLPAQIVRSVRRIIHRIMGYISYLKHFLAAWEKLRRMAPA
jgi:hypothetical protein